MRSVVIAGALIYSIEKVRQRLVMSGALVTGKLLARE
jgi:hypothetical protein